MILNTLVTLALATALVLSLIRHIVNLETDDDPKIYFVYSLSAIVSTVLIGLSVIGS
jgi:hypothetical protein